MKRQFVVTIELPIGTTEQHMGNYMLDALRQWCLSRPEHDPIFQLRPETVKIHVLPTITTVHER